ncbi:MAG TPA: hypothetical protein VFM94_03115, partial [Solirubrobacterales bacterium]|nr:hypothetical protein [Solirubrobacterales bacterium]
EAGKEAKVFNGVTAISGDGSRVYFVAQGVLTDEASPTGATPQTNKPNLYMWDEESGATAFLGKLVAADAIKSNVRGIGLWGGQGTWRNNAYPVPVTGAGSGRILPFLSKAELTAADADGEHLDVYRYQAGPDTPTLTCISCRPGGPDSEPLDVDIHSQTGPGRTDFAEERRWVSEDGETVGFLTPEGLVPGDVNEADDFYLWHEGELVRVPGKPFATGDSDGPFLSHDGSVVAFTTSSALLPQDGDTVADVYVARVGGGYPNPAVSDPCEVGRNCQPSESPPATPNPASSTFNGPGNVTPKSQACPPKKRKVRRKGKVRCVPKHPRKSASKEHKRARHANADRRNTK